MITANYPDLDLDNQSLEELFRFFNWKPFRRATEFYQAWIDERDDIRSETLIPKDGIGDEAFADYAERALGQLFARYGQRAHDHAVVLSRKSQQAMEETHWVQETTLEPGLISWTSGVALFTSARNQLAAAAKSTRQNRRRHLASSADIAKYFLNATYMGQTGAGSFIITAYTPSAAVIDGSVLEGQDQLIPGKTSGKTGKDVMDTLERSLGSLRQGLDDYKKSPVLELFDDTVVDGVSSELASALGVMSAAGSSSIRMYRVAAHGQSKEIRFNHEESAVLKLIAERFAVEHEPVDVNLIGDVTLLERDDKKHLIRIIVQNDPTVKRVLVALDEENYAMAVDAHRSEKFLRVKGTLKKEGNRYWIRDVKGVEEMPDEVPDVMPVSEQVDLFAASLT